jgi:hypothetical protein
MTDMAHRTKSPRTRVLLGTSALLVSLLIPSCKWGVPEYTLTVIVEEGITGVPEAGQYTYDELAQVDFAYTGVNSLHTVEVLLNDRIRNPAAGTIILYDDGYELKAKLVDIRGEWEIVMTYDDSSIDPLEFTLTIEGADLLSGTLTDSLGHHGSWTAESNSLILAYWDWDFHVLSNTVFYMGSQAGAFIGGGQTGTWTAKKPE